MMEQQYRLFRIVGFVLLLSCAFVQFRFAVVEQEIFIGKKNTESTLQSKNAKLLTESAKRKHLLEADLPEARNLLKRALESNPYFIPAWLGLAEVDNDLGFLESSDRILNYVHHLTRDIKRWRWEKALVAYQLGRNELLAGELKYIISEIKGKPKNDALQLAFNIWNEPIDLLNNIGSNNLISLLNFSVEKGYAEHVIYFFSILENQKVDYQEFDLLRVINMLMGLKYPQLAGDIWRKHVNPDGIIFNGDFKYSLMQRAFGWRTEKTDGVVVKFTEHPKKEKGRALHLRFSGWDNVMFKDLYQIVPLSGGSIYRLNFQYKSDRLTTDQRPYFEVFGYECEEQIHYKTNMLESSQPWTTVNLEFGVPKECSASVVRLRRNESRRIDSKISGSLWIKDVEISNTGKEYTVFEWDES